MKDPLDLSKRERQIMEVLYARGEGSAGDVLEKLQDPPTRTAIRTLLRILADKGHLTHSKRGRETVYQPTRPQQQVGRGALRRLLGTFFEGSLQQAVAAYLSDSRTQVSEQELDGLRDLIDQARRKG